MAQRNPLIAALLSAFTLNLYLVYWFYKINKELEEQAKVKLTLPAIVIALLFFLPPFIASFIPNSSIQLFAFIFALLAFSNTRDNIDKATKDKALKSRDDKLLFAYIIAVSLSIGLGIVLGLGFGVPLLFGALALLTAILAYLFPAFFIYLMQSRENALGLESSYV